MVSKVILVKDHGYSDSDVRPYASVKDYSFGGSDILPYVRMFVRPHEGTFQHQLQLVYYSIRPPLHHAWVYLYSAPSTKTLFYFPNNVFVTIPERLKWLGMW